MREDEGIFSWVVLYHVQFWAWGNSKHFPFHFTLFIECWFENLLSIISQSLQLMTISVLFVTDVWFYKWSKQDCNSFGRCRLAATWPSCSNRVIWLGQCFWRSVRQPCQFCSCLLESGLCFLQHFIHMLFPFELPKTCLYAFFCRKKKVEMPSVSDPALIPPPYVVRVILLYGRSNCLPTFSSREVCGQRNFANFPITRK